MVDGGQLKVGAERPARGSLVWRLAISGLLVGHLLAVFIPPFTFATRSGSGVVSPFAEPIAQVLRPYVDLMFLDHGYFFFAPNPGPSHLLRAKLEFSDGRPPLELTFPDHKQQWPRLNYHRHFMLAEQLHADFVPSDPPPESTADPAQRASWQFAHNRYLARKKSFEDHLRHVYGAQRVTLSRWEHTLLTPDEFRAGGRPIQAPGTYLELSENSEPLPPVETGGGR